MHTPLITTIAAGFFVAWLLGMITQRIGLSPIVGYLLAGVVIGPATGLFHADIKIAHELAEVGVILLMFGVGLHFHFKDLMAVKGVAIVGAIGQSLVATLLGIALAVAAGFPAKSGFVVGMALAVASTVVLIRMLEDRKLLDKPEGHVAVGWLVVEDIFTVIVLVIIPIIGSTADAGEATPGDFIKGLGVVLLKLAIFVAGMVFIGRRAIPWLLVRVARSRSRELFTLTVLVFSIALAAGAYSMFGASMALGAFLAGMMVAQSPSSSQVAADALPLRDAFAVLFFVSVGMLFDWQQALDRPGLLAGALAIVLIGKPLAAFILVLFMGRTSRTALTVAVALAQIGEFSFILSDAARQYGLIMQAGHNTLIATAIVSITLNPFLFGLLPRMEQYIERRPALWRFLNRRVRGSARAGNITTIRRMTEIANVRRRLAVVVGFGPVGQAVDRLLREADIDTVVIDANIETVLALQAQKRNAVFGDASRSAILEQAGIKRATHLILTFPDAEERTAVISAARNLNPDLRVLVRARYLSEKADLDQAGASAAVFEEAESAVALARLVLTDTGASRDVVEGSVRDLKLRLILENLSDLSGRTVRNVMVPWSRVRRLSNAFSLETVLGMIAKERYSRWPVEDSATGKPIGYLLVKDLVGGLPQGTPWTTLIRTLVSVSPEEPIEPTLRQLQAEGATVCLVEDEDRPVGLFTIEDILEQVVGRIEDEYPRRASITIHDALASGAVLMKLSATTVEDAIGEMAAAIPAGRLPAAADIREIALVREREIHTDVGLGVAMPHARCPNLPEPIVVFARAPEGIVFNPGSTEPVRLIFLLVTPSEQPEIQVYLLSQLARLVGDAAIREQLATALSREEVLEIVKSSPAGERRMTELPSDRHR